jgi:hypothetical protein
MNAAQGAVPVPQVQVFPDRAARGQVFRERLPLTARPEHVEDRIQDLTHVHRPRTPAAFARPDQRGNEGPLGVGQVAIITQAAPICCCPMFRLPHEAPRSNSGAARNHNRLQTLNFFPDGL